MWSKATWPVYKVNIAGNVKPNVWQYFDKTEIYSLFLQPLCIILAYIVLVWHIVKLYCDIKNFQDFISTLKWIRNKSKYASDDFNQK
ncbi:hypothetical protein BdWA1_002456 [Babesia duncani]|uniref:Uncharacterized protein n=1 Tax=Babesia duncani TaxID=323732 RepID=A0AAD9PJ87_9APIC|nr:hypothetical protein BdWA1_002456 [Babesia duncani]